VLKAQFRWALVRRYAVEGLKFCLRWWMLRAKRIGRSKSATQTGRGRRIVSTKQDVSILSVHPSQNKGKVTYKALNAITTKLRHL
jgi:hypothetical protein